MNLRDDLIQEATGVPACISATWPGRFTTDLTPLEILQRTAPEAATHRLACQAWELRNRIATGFLGFLGFCLGLLLLTALIGAGWEIYCMGGWQSEAVFLGCILIPMGIGAAVQQLNTPAPELLLPMDPESRMRRAGVR